MAVNTSFKQFAGRMKAHAKALIPAVNRIHRELVAVIDNAVIIYTPVDTGLARSNWIVSEGRTVDIVISPYVPGDRLGLSETGNAAAAIAQGLSVLAGAPLNATVFYIQNNVPYIGLLDSGSSKQAPTNFVNLAILTGIHSLNNQVLSLRA